MVLIGLDIGGTSVRCVVASPKGVLLGLGRGPGANFRSSGPEAAEHVKRAVSEAMAVAGTSADDVIAVAAGAAGAAEAGREQVRELLGDVLGRVGLPAPELREDLEVAFRSASARSHGFLLLAGTGAVAASFEDWRRSGRCDGMGWVLGDAGSGLWLGRRVLRAAAADLDRRGPSTRLTSAVLATVGLAADGDQRQALISAITPLPPSAWGSFAPLAIEADGADEVATALLDEAAAHLLGAARAVGAVREIVYAGGLLAGGGLRGRLEEHFHGAYAAFPVAGACAVAAEVAGLPFDLGTLVDQLAASTEEAGQLATSRSISDRPRP